mmetsp:Transcript_11867/g.15526  ORF Transcript_11867/g.15526 Transcript_11867/m.15526 type:complete len:380 (+) Transcript_11867:184-1323(+)
MHTLTASMKRKQRILFLSLILCQPILHFSKPHVHKSDRFKAIECYHAKFSKHSRDFHCYATNEEHQQIFSFEVHIDVNESGKFSEKLNRNPHMLVRKNFDHFSVSVSETKVVAGANYSSPCVVSPGSSCFLRCQQDPCEKCLSLQSKNGGKVDGDPDKARFRHPSGIALIKGGVLIADRGNQALRLMNTATGRVTTVFNFKDNVVDVTSNFNGSKVFVGLHQPRTESFRIAQIDLKKRKILSTVPKFSNPKTELNGLSLSLDSCILLVCTNNPGKLYVYDTCKSPGQITFSYKLDISCHAVTSPHNYMAYAVQRSPNKIHFISLRSKQIASLSFDGNGGHGMSKVFYLRYVFIAATYSDAFFVCDLQRRYNMCVQLPLT